MAKFRCFASRDNILPFKSEDSLQGESLLLFMRRMNAQFPASDRWELEFLRTDL